MTRIFFFCAILLTCFYTLINPQVALAETYNGPPASCAIPGKVINVRFEKETTIGQRVRARVTFDANTTNLSWHFFIKVPVGVGVDLESPDITLGGTTPVEKNGNQWSYDFETRDSIRNYRDSYEIDLDHSEDPGSPEVCKLGTFTITDNDINNSQCTVITPTNVQAGRPFPISISFNPVANVNYSLQLYPSANAPNPGPEGQILKTPSSQFNDKINRSQSVYTVDTIANPNTLINYRNDGTGGFRRLETGGGYVVYVFAAKILQGAETFYKYCKFPFQVTNLAPTPTFKVNGADQATAPKGGTVTLGWAAMNDATPTSWVGIFRPGDDDGSWIVSRYTSSSCGTSAGSVARPDGSCTFPLPNDPGTYEFRMFKDLTNTHLTEIRPKVTVIDTPVGPPPPPPGGPAACTDPATCSSAGGTPCAGGAGIETALGCLRTDTPSLIKALMGLAAGIAGAIALILMIIGSAQMLTSAGNPELIKKGRDTFVSAVIGLLFIIFSVTILQILGFDILNIPGFNR